MSRGTSAPAAAADATAGSAAGSRTLARLVRYFLKLGCSGFGGPIALVDYMQRDLVEQRGWFTEAEYRQGLALAQTMPGPLAAQLAMWFGFLQAGALGAAAVAVPFVLPPCLLVTAVAVLYTKYQGLAVVHEIFLGVGPAVLAIIAIAAYKLVRTTNKTDPLLWAIAGCVCAATAIAKTEIVWAVPRRRGVRSSVLRRGAAAPARVVGRERVPGRDGRGGEGVCLDRLRVGGGDTGAVLRQGQRVHVRLWIGDRAVPSPGARARSPLLTEQQFRRRGRDGADQPRAGGDHGDLRRLPRRRPDRRADRHACGVHAGLAVRDRAGRARHPAAAPTQGPRARAGRGRRRGRDPRSALAVPILATSSIFSTGHIALTRLISGALAAAVALFWNDWLAPTVTWVVLGIYGALRSPIEPRRYEQSRLGATVIAFAVNVMTI